ncbi:MAG: enoyl-[acyl-carrier-protein] reductase FabK [Eubacteriales bacterium]|nr:enoyl-[acyl-carrier-protein] reductase FabK [Eubacteriales bacterium]
MKTKITQMLGIQYPVFQGAMAWIADAELAAAVSNAGGLGIIAGGAAPVTVVQQEIRRAKELTDQPFAVNIMLLNPTADALAQLVIDEGVPVVTTGAGSPAKYIKQWKQAGIKVIPVVASTAYARRMERMGVDAVIAEGMESGGHIGETTTMALLPQVIDSVDIPVVAAGGIADGRGLAAARLFGAEGVQCGTIFLSAKECNISEQYKQMIYKANDISTVVTGRASGHPVRSLKSPLSRKLVQMEGHIETRTLEEIEAMTAGSLRKAVQDGNYEEGTFMSGQIAGLVKDNSDCKTIIETMVHEAEILLRNAPSRIG